MSRQRKETTATKRELTNSAPTSGGIGMHLLQKMGWRPGEGLGKEKNGSIHPLKVEIKIDKRGLHANEELKQFKKQKLKEMQQQMEIKHPVTLLGEIAVKRKLDPPVYTVVSENGPLQEKAFIVKVSFNGAKFQPAAPCASKKEAKALAAKFCLQKLGILRIKKR